jgi:PAS domain S-box-containing protein
VDEDKSKTTEKAVSPADLPKVLVAEDDEGLNRLIQTALQREGFKTEGIFTGSDTISRADSGRNAILLIDYKLPDMTAGEVIKNLRDKKSYPPFIVVTGQGDENVAVEMMKLGARDYVVKSAGLIDVISHVVLRIVKEMNRDRALENAEGALRESESRYRGLVETSEGLIWQSDNKGKFTYLNKAWEKTHGYRIHEMIGRTFADFQKPETVEKERQVFQKLLNAEPLTGHETVHTSKSGKEIFLALNAVPIIDSNNQVIGIQGTAFDITKRVNKEKDVRNSKEAFFNMIEDVNEAFKALEALFTGLVRTMINALDAKSPWTRVIQKEWQ